MSQFRGWKYFYAPLSGTSARSWRRLIEDVKPLRGFRFPVTFPICQPQGYSNTATWARTRPPRPRKHADKYHHAIAAFYRTSYCPSSKPLFWATRSTRTFIPRSETENAPSGSPAQCHRRHWSPNLNTLRLASRMSEVKLPPRTLRRTRRTSYLRHLNGVHVRRKILSALRHIPCLEHCPHLRNPRHSNPQVSEQNRTPETESVGWRRHSRKDR
jgi:hypothetical protein